MDTIPLSEIKRLVRWPLYAELLEKIDNNRAGSPYVKATSILKALPLEKAIEIVTVAFQFTPRELATFNFRIASFVLPLYEQMHPENGIPAATIQVVTAFHNDEADLEELQAYASMMLTISEKAFTVYHFHLWHAECEDTEDSVESYKMYALKHKAAAGAAYAAYYATIGHAYSVVEAAQYALGKDTEELSNIVCSALQSIFTSRMKELDLRDIMLKFRCSIHLDTEPEPFPIQFEPDGFGWVQIKDKPRATLLSEDISFVDSLVLIAYDNVVRGYMNKLKAQVSGWHTLLMTQRSCNQSPTKEKACVYPQNS